MREKGNAKYPERTALRLTATERTRIEDAIALGKARSLSDLVRQAINEFCEKATA